MKQLHLLGRAAATSMASCFIALAMPGFISPVFTRQLWLNPSEWSDQLWTLQAEMNSCLAQNMPQPCRKASKILDNMRKQAPYEYASHLCHEEIDELLQLLVSPVGASQRQQSNLYLDSVIDVRLACLPYYESY